VVHPAGAGEPHELRAVDLGEFARHVVLVVSTGPEGGAGSHYRRCADPADAEKVWLELRFMCHTRHDVVALEPVRRRAAFVKLNTIAVERE
jgi:hypothetical protein